MSTGPKTYKLGKTSKQESNRPEEAVGVNFHPRRLNMVGSPSNLGYGTFPTSHVRAPRRSPKAAAGDVPKDAAREQNHEGRNQFRDGQGLVRRVQFRALAPWAEIVHVENRQRSCARSVSRGHA